MQRPAPWHLARYWPWVLGVGALLALFGAKFRLIQFFGSDVPFGDQWYGELTTTYAPFLDGTFTWQTLFSPHFEHRIVWTRLLDLALLAANGSWDPRLQLVADSFIILTAVAVLLRHVLRALTPLSAAVATGFIALFFGSQMLWENTLWGFQSQFYFLLLFSLVHVLETSAGRPWSPAWWIGNVAGLANLFTMAGGPISAVAALGHLAWRRWRCREAQPGDLFLAAWNLALIACGILLLPEAGIGRHGSPNPGIGELFRRICDVLSWPAMDWRFGLLVWAPALGFLIRCVLTPAKRFGPAWLMPLVLLALGFALSVSYARGGALASRYSDFYCVSVIANLICLLTWPVPARWSRLKLALLWVATLFLIQWLKSGEQAAYLFTLEKDVGHRREEGDSIRQYFRTANPRVLRGKGSFETQEIAALEAIRTTPRLQGIMPQSLQLPHPLAAANDDNVRGFSSAGVPEIPGLPPDCPAWGSFRGNAADCRWTSAPLSTHQPFVVFYIAGELRPPATQLKLVTADGRAILPLQNEVRATEKWVRLNFQNPGEPFQVVAADSDASISLAFSAPFELGRFSRLSAKLLRGWDVLLWSGWLLFGIAALVPLVSERLGESRWINDPEPAPPET